ncbi:hypothetical protein KAS79_04225 [Candidatus Parcubacteria bacterium]|nr:hypothetical protein [Candidatus Parcubacteria bacterium]
MTNEIKREWVIPEEQASFVLLENKKPVITISFFEIEKEIGDLKLSRVKKYLKNKQDNYVKRSNKFSQSSRRSK